MRADVSTQITTLTPKEADCHCPTDLWKEKACETANEMKLATKATDSRNPRREARERNNAHVSVGGTRKAITGRAL